ncbi:MAG: hypothetical protein ABII09_02205 [Planctomycetota bacterium]
MARPFQILCLAAMVLLGGCTDNRQEPQLDGIKIDELAPTGRTGRAVQPRVLQTTNIDVTTFELPAENIGRLVDIWNMLSTGSLRYNNSAGFAANGLQASAGKYDAYHKIIALLKSADAKKLSTTSLLIPNGQAEMLNIGRLTRKTTISYIGRRGDVETADAGPGTLGLQVSARQFSGSQPVANVHVVPLISASTEGLPKELAERLRENDLRFYSAGFRVIMKQGDILMLAPREYNPDETAAAGRFFIKPEPNPTVILLLFICTSIS